MGWNIQAKWFFFPHSFIFSHFRNDYKYSSQWSQEKLAFVCSVSSPPALLLLSVSQTHSRCQRKPLLQSVLQWVVGGGGVRIGLASNVRAATLSEPDSITKLLSLLCDMNCWAIIWSPVIYTPRTANKLAGAPLQLTSADKRERRLNLPSYCPVKWQLMCRRDVNRKSRRLNQYPNHKSQRGGECFHCYLLLPDHHQRLLRLFVWTIQPSVKSFDSFKKQTVPMLKWNTAVWLGVLVLQQGVDSVSSVQYSELFFLSCFLCNPKLTRTHCN